MPEKEMEELFHLVVSKDELTMLVLGQSAVAGLFDGNVTGAMIAMIAQFIQLKVQVRGQDFEAAHVRVVNKIGKLADGYDQAKRKEKHV